MTNSANAPLGGPSLGTSSAAKRFASSHPASGRMCSTRAGSPPPHRARWLRRHWPETDERALSRDEVIELQEILNVMGIDVGTPDGILGSRTRTAIRTFQEESGLPTDGYATYDLLAMMRVMAISE